MDNERKGLPGGGGGQPDISSEERLERALREGKEKEKRQIELLVGRMEVLAQRARHQKNITPSFSIQGKLKTAQEVRRLKTEYDELRKEVERKTNRIAYGNDGGEFKKIVQSHLKVLDSCFDLEGDYGFKPIKD